MATTKKQRGRPTTPPPEPIDATPEELAEAFLAVPPDHQWQYPKDNKKGAAK